MGKILWLASYPKSGNTWMRVFLHNVMRNPKDGYDINRITDLSLGDSGIQIYTPYLKTPPGTWSLADVQNVRHKAQFLLTKSTPDTVFAKTHNALVEYMDIPMIDMSLTAGAIYIVRNPLDVVISAAHHYGRDIDGTIDLLNDDTNGTVTTDKIVFEIHKSWSTHVLSWTSRPHPSLKVVRYEDMLQKPVETFGGICRFLGLPVERSRLDRAIKLSSFDNLRKQEEKKGFREKSVNADRFFRSGKSGEWREVLTDAQVARIVDVHREQMTRFGYLPL